MRIHRSCRSVLQVVFIVSYVFIGPVVHTQDVLTATGIAIPKSQATADAGDGHGPVPSPKRLECAPEFIQASIDAWTLAMTHKDIHSEGDGFGGAEAGFFAVGPVSSLHIVRLHYTNQSGTLKGMHIPAGAIALVHTHGPRVRPTLSEQDIASSNASGLIFYVISSEGLSKYNPGFKKEFYVRTGFDWEKPCIV